MLGKGRAVRCRVMKQECRAVKENITSGQSGDCLVYLGLLMILASRRTGSAGIMCVSNGLTGGTGSRFIDGELGMW